MEQVWRERLATIALLLIVGLHFAVVAHLLPRKLDHDEGEHLRASEWVASGKRLYRDFNENHTPFLYMMLARFAPTDLDFDALRQYVTNARLLAAAAGTAAALLVALFGWRVAGDPVAVVPALAALLTRGLTYERSLLDVRSEPFTLLLFWGGVLLIVRENGASPRRRAAMAGLGAALIAVAAVWNPKWPLETLAIGVWYAALLWQAARRSWRDAALSFGIAAAGPIIAVLIALRAAPLGALIFFGYRYPAAFYSWFRSSPLVPATFNFPWPFYYCSTWFQPTVAIPAIALLVIVMIIEWRSMDVARRRLAVLLGAFVVSGALEIRFLYSYPNLWPQYFVMWGCSLAATYGVVLSASTRRYAKWTVAAVVVIVALFVAGAVLELDTPVDQRHWQFKEDLLANLHPGEAVWFYPDDAPFAAPAGSYYWYALKDQVPFSIMYARTPEGRRWLPPVEDVDLPPCRMLWAHQHALPRNAFFVRFMDQRGVQNLPQSRQCFAGLVAQKSVRWLGADLYEILPPRRY